MKCPLLWIALLLPLAAPAAVDYQPPRFTESVDARRAKIARVAPEIDRAFADFAAERHVPGLVWGVVLDGELVHRGALGVANVAEKIPATADTRFRIASMSKSFTALAILKLRDAGRLALTDLVAKYLPEFAAVQPLTTDAPAITVRHLLTMTPGFPEDNPWGDRQLAVGVKEFAEFVRSGVALSNVPGVAFEYSNLAFALLGQIISRVAEEPYEAYITREILVPLGLRDTRWEYADVPAAQLALGYRWENNAWRPEPLLHDGTYGAMGGLLTTLNDFARYVSFHLAAWPPRNDAESLVAPRSTVREMQQPAAFTGLAANGKSLAGETVASANFYAHGLIWSVDSQNVVRVGHSGGLPGFGSIYRFYPEHGIGVIAFANLTYAAPAVPAAKAGALLIEQAKLPRRELPASAILQTRTQQLARLLQSWDTHLGDEILAENFFLDRSREDWKTRAHDALAPIGAITAVGAVAPENQLRGKFLLVGEKGRVEVFFTLTPEKNPRVQQLRLTPVKN